MSRRAAEWLFVIVGWTVIAVVFGVSSSLTFMLTYRPPQWAQTMASAAADWYPWAALTPAVTWLARRLRLRRARWTGHAAALALVGLVVAFLKLTLTRILRQSTGVTEYLAITSFVTQYFIFWGLIAATHATEHYRESRERELRAMQLEASLAQARLQLLTMQLQPHFLFNTLNTIAELVHDRPEDADRMITGLAQLLRETLDRGLADLVPLDHELSVLSRFVDIQQVRFGDRLSFRIDADSVARAALVPSLLLQPLVENAIKYTIAVRRSGGQIVVRARKNENLVILEVHDDGDGFRLEAMREGVGITNTRARLTEMFGAAHDFSMVSQPGAGTTVRMSFPFRT